MKSYLEFEKTIFDVVRNEISDFPTLAFGGGVRVAVRPTSPEAKDWLGMSQRLGNLNFREFVFPVDYKGCFSDFNYRDNNCFAVDAYAETAEKMSKLFTTHTCGSNGALLLRVDDVHNSSFCMIGICVSGPLPEHNNACAESISIEIEGFFADECFNIEEMRRSEWDKCSVALIDVESSNLAAYYYSSIEDRLGKKLDGYSADIIVKHVDEAAFHKQDPFYKNLGEFVKNSDIIAEVIDGRERLAAAFKNNGGVASRFGSRLVSMESAVYNACMKIGAKRILLFGTKSFMKNGKTYFKDFPIEVTEGFRDETIAEIHGDIVGGHLKRGVSCPAVAGLRGRVRRVLQGKECCDKKVDAIVFDAPELKIVFGRMFEKELLGTYGCRVIDAIETHIDAIVKASLH